MSRFRGAGKRPDGPLEGLDALFWDNEGPVVHKWLHYLPIYETHFARFRDRPFRMLEIGVHQGGSLQMWRRYFGPQATIYGIDIDPDCAEYDGLAGQVRIGSQANPEFLRAVVAEMGGVDLVLDDGSHHADHQRVSLEALFPLLSEGGIYAIEDLHTAYWGADFAGGEGRTGGFMAVLKDMLDDMHHWHHDAGEQVAATAGHLKGMHLYDSVAVLEKGRVDAPSHVRRGTEKGELT